MGSLCPRRVLALGFVRGNALHVLKVVEGSGMSGRRPRRGSGPAEAVSASSRAAMPLGKTRTVANRSAAFVQVIHGAADQRSADEPIEIPHISGWKTTPCVGEGTRA